LVIIYRPRSGE